MFKAETMNEFFFLPRLDLGRLWRWLKVEPVRPNSQEQSAVIVAAIEDRDAREFYGDVYKTADGRFFFAPVNGVTMDLKTDEIEEIRNPHPDIISSDKGIGHKNKQSLAKLHKAENLGIVYDPAIKAALVRAYYGKKAPQKLIELSLA